MNDSSSTREELLAELRALRAELAELKAEAETEKAAVSHQPNGDLRRLQAEQSLRESDERFRSLAEKSPSMIFINQGGRVVYANPQSEKLLGYSNEEMCAPDFDFRRLIAPESADLVAQMFAKHTRGEEVDQYEYTVITKDGRRIDAINATRMITYGGKPAILGVVTDVSDLVKTRRALEESEHLYRTLIETSPDSIMLIDLQGRILMANDAAAHHQGYTSAVELLADTRPSFDWLSPEARESTMRDFETVLREGRVTNAVFETIDDTGTRGVRESNASLVRDADGRPKAIVAITRDITERQRNEEERLQLERQMLHAQKLESLGILAGGIAHDFNNLLTGILGSASLALRHLDDPQKAQKNLELVRTAAKRAADLTRQMLAYSGKGAFEVRPLNVGKLVEEIGELLESSIPKKARLRFQNSGDLPLVQADSAQLQQIVMNLLTNAGEALGDSVGEIVITTGVVQPDRSLMRDPRLTGDLTDAPYVYIEVRDTGCGMEPATSERMFEPFFTTKFAGRGLGLAAVIGIVKGHGGAVLVDSQPGVGTAVRVFLPADATAPATQPEGGEEVEFSSQGTVLIVDDEPVVREVAVEILREMGLKTLEANNGKQALEIFRRREAVIDAVLLDLTMPELSGEEVLRAIREIRPDVPVVLTSGFEQGEVARRFEGLDVVGFVQKPFHLRELHRMLHLAIGKRDD